MSWTADVIEVLVVAKVAGFTFEQAWTEALEQYPPRMMDRGRRELALFDENGEVEDETLAEFTERVARDAWEGRHSVLRGLPELREHLDGDDHSTAAHNANGGRSLVRLRRVA